MGVWWPKCANPRFFTSRDSFEASEAHLGHKLHLLDDTVVSGCVQKDGKIVFDWLSCVIFIDLRARGLVYWAPLDFPEFCCCRAVRGKQR